jgi:hypothetical protein
VQFSAALKVFAKFISLAGLLLVSAVATPFVASVAFTLSVLVVLTSIVAAITSHGTRGTYWRGFALFATAYFLLVLILGSVWTSAGTDLGTTARPPKPVFVTTYLMAWLHDSIGQPFVTASGARISALQILCLTNDEPPSESGIVGYSACMTAGHSLFTICCGLLGGWISSHLKDMIAK